MNDWQEIVLGDLIKVNSNSITRRFPFDKIFYLDTGSITSGMVEQYQELLLTEAPSRARRLVQDKDIIYSSVRPNQRHYGIMKNPEPNLVVSTGFIVITCDTTQLHPKFLYYYLTSGRSVEYLHSLAEGSTSAYPSLKPSDIEALEILLPPLPEQRAIASVLSSLDDKIDLLHRQNETLEALAQTLFRQWFVEEAEDDWEEGSLSDIAQHIKENVRPDKSPEAGFYHFSIPAFDDGKYPIKEKGTEIKSNKYQVLPNSILISKLNPRFPRVWAIQDNIPENSICSTEFQVVYPMKPDFYSFIYCFLKSHQVTNELIGAASGTSGSHQRVKPNVIFNLKYKTKDHKQISDFHLLVSDNWKKIKLNLEQIRTLEILRDTLLPKLMRGEVRVR